MDDVCPDYSRVVPKLWCHRSTPCRTSPRFVYAVGLEHTGHHLWHEGLYPLVCTPRGNSSKLRGLFELINTGLDLPCVPLSMQRSVRDYLLKAVSVGAGLTCQNSCSYPCSPYQRPRNPDIVVLARASNAARVDLRLLVLTRAVVEVVGSWVEVVEL